MNRRKSSKFLGVLLALMMVVAMMPTYAFAATPVIQKVAPLDAAYTMQVGDTVEFTVDKPASKSVKWTTSKGKVASVKKATKTSAKIKAKKAGTATIKAKVGKKNVSWKVTVVKKYTTLQRNDWNPEVKAALNELAQDYGIKGKYSSETNYVVFDFDNTCSIFDMQEQLSIYQLSKMAFAITPDQLEDVLKTEIDPDYAVGRGTDYCDNNASYQDWIDDIVNDYACLVDTYGQFTAEGVDEETEAALATDPVWQDFAVKMRAMYDLIFDNESADVAYPWILYWFTGMTRAEAYNLAARSHAMYKNLETSEPALIAPDQDIVGEIVGEPTKVMINDYTYTSGVQVSQNIQELWRVLYNNDIDIIVCSASATDNIMAAIDTFGLHNYLAGLLAMTVKTDENGVYTNAYDYETGYVQVPIKGKLGPEGWTEGWEGYEDLPTMAQTQGQGKVTAIDNTCKAVAGVGPIAGFMDSTGDCAFTTEYENLKVVACFNRASRKVTDGGGVIAELAVYQRDYLGYETIAQAQANGDTLYVLQGRDEYGLRGFRASRNTMRYGKDNPLLFRGQDNYTQLAYMMTHAMTTEQIINKFFVKTSAADSELGFKYGFWTDYPGYHTNK